MKATIDNFTGTTGQKMFAKDIVNKAIERLAFEIKDATLRIENRKAAGEKTEKTERTLAANKERLAKIEEMLAGKKVSAKKIIESARKVDHGTLGNTFILDI